MLGRRSPSPAARSARPQSGRLLKISARRHPGRCPGLHLRIRSCPWCLQDGGDDLELAAAVRAVFDGFRNILHGMNSERALTAAAAIGLGRVALKRAAQYANERIVFDRQIGMNQGVQHSLAKCWMELEAARLMVMNAAWKYDQKMECGAEANAAKYLAGEAGFKACETAVITHGARNACWGCRSRIEGGESLKGRPMQVTPPGGTLAPLKTEYHSHSSTHWRRP